MMERDMASSQTGHSGGTQSGAQVSDDLVAKVGAAVSKVVVIQQSYAARAQADGSPDYREALADEAEREAVQAIDDQGLSVEQYNTVLNAAEGDPGLEERLLSAARAAS